MDWRGGGGNKTPSVIHRKGFKEERKGRGEEVVKTPERGSLLNGACGVLNGGLTEQTKHTSLSL